MPANNYVPYVICIRNFLTSKRRSCDTNSQSYIYPQEDELNQPLLLSMITERIQQSSTNLNTTKYYQFATILEHVIDCFHTIVSDETNPYYPPLAWLTRKHVRPTDDELFLDLIEQCSMPKQLDATASDVTNHGDNNNISNNNNPSDNNNIDDIFGYSVRGLSPIRRGSTHKLSSSVCLRLAKCSPELRKDIVSRKKDGCAPLFLACKQGHLEIVKYLLDSCNADIEQTGLYETLEDHHVHSVTPLWVAAVSGNIEVVRLLIERKANVNSVSDTGSTTLRSVCFLCKDDDNQRDDDHGPNPQPPSIDSGDVYMDIVRLLVENGADVTKPNHNGGTCLINSIHNYELTRYILDHGANIDATAYQFKTALHYAIQQGRYEVTRLLLSRGANKDLRANLCDDALQLACLKGHIKIFEFLINRYRYPKKRVADAYKLIGASILELHFDLAKVRQLWRMAIEIENHRCPGAEHAREGGISILDGENAPILIRYSNGSSPSSSNLFDQQEDLFRTQCNEETKRFKCDKWRSKAFSDMREFSSLEELDSMTTDGFRIQSLLISERVLGPYHRETIQRLLYRGTFYVNSLQPDRCISLWIYALKLRLEHDSIFHIEPIFAAQAITRLFLDLLSQHRQNNEPQNDNPNSDLNLQAAPNGNDQAIVGRVESERAVVSQPMPDGGLDDSNGIVKFTDVYDVLVMLIDELEGCKKHLSFRPTSVLHEDIFDLLLAIIVNLLFVLRCVARIQELGIKARSSRIKVNRLRLVEELVRKLIRIDPRTSISGSTLLHLMLAPSVLDGDMHRLLSSLSDNLNSSRTQVTTPPPVQTSADSITGIRNSHRYNMSSPSQAGNNHNNNNNQTQKSSGSQLARVISELIEMFLSNGFNIDSVDACGHSALQVLCLTNVRCNADKIAILRLLVDCGAHVDRHTVRPEQRDLIRQSLREAGINPSAYVTLACLAARKIAECSSKYDFGTSSLPSAMREIIATH